MATFIFRCPTSGQNVQGSIAQGSVEQATTCVSVNCTACGQFHYVDLATGRVLGGEDDSGLGNDDE